MRTPSIKRAMYLGHRFASSTSTRASFSMEPPLSASLGRGTRSGAPVSACTSRAMPRCESASGRLGVTFSSKIVSGSPSACSIGVPIRVSRGKVSSPAWSSESPTSRAEQSIPELSTPRSFARPIRWPPGSTAPGRAIGTTSPTWKFCAPQTTWCVPRPSPTWPTLRWSEPAMRSLAAMRAATTSAPGPRVRCSVPSTSNPAKVSLVASSPSGRSVAHSSRSQFSDSFMAALSQLLQEADVVVEEEPQVVDPVAQHRQPVDAHAERVPGVLLRIDAHAGQLVGVHHPGAEHLHPAAALADLAALPAAERVRDVHLGGGLGEGEVAGPQPRLDVGAEERLHERVERAAQVRHRHALLHVQALDLVEHRRVRHVGVAAVYLPRRDDADGRLARLEHGADLHRARVRAQDARGRLGRSLWRRRQRRGVERERVLHVARRVVDGETELLEVVDVPLDLRTVGDVEPQAGEDLDNVVHRQRDRVAVTELLRAPGERDVELLPPQVSFQRAIRDRL